MSRILNNDRFHQLVGTVITPDKKMSDPNAPFVELVSNASKVTVRVFSYDGDTNFRQHVCKAASSSSDTKTDTVTQTVPFSCLDGVLDHGFMRSFALLERAPKGGDLAYDLTPYTRDLPLSPYVAPTAVGAQVIFGFDTTGRCTLSIGTGLSPLHVQPGELVGQNLFDVYADDLDGLAALRRAIDGESLTLEREFMDRVLAIYYEPSRDAEGRVTGVLGVTTDVTEQRRIEREVHEARLRATLLADISASLAQETLDPEALLRLVARSVAEPVADAGTVWLRFDANSALERRARWCRDGVPEPAERTVPPDTADLRATELRPAPGPDGTTYVRVPLRSRGLLLGFVDVARSPERGGFTDAELGLVTDIARRCALSLDNARLLEDRRVAHEELIKFE